MHNNDNNSGTTGTICGPVLLLMPQSDDTSNTNIFQANTRACPDTLISFMLLGSKP